MRKFYFRCKIKVRFLREEETRMEKIKIDSPLSVLSGVGPARKKALETLGLHTVRDLLFYFPRAYEDRGNISLLREGLDGEKRSYLLTVGTEPRNALIRKGMTLTKFRAFDESGTVEIVFFNQPYLREVFRPGKEFRFFGKLQEVKRIYQLSSPAYEEVVEGKELKPYIPVYALAEGVSRNLLDKLASEALNAILPILPDPLPDAIRTRQKLCRLSHALRGVHEPTDHTVLETALRRLIFDDFFVFSLSLALRKERDKTETAKRLPFVDISPLTSLLPYELTNAQKRSVNEILSDMQKGNGANRLTVPMSRILIGDVGSGKTVCAAIALYAAVKAGHQAVLMAPTEILARQHFSDISDLFKKLNIRVELLLGSTTEKNKKRIYEAVSKDADDRIDLLIGTHALLNDKIDFYDLSLVVTDEQHRFGVMQRAALQKKGNGCHLLVMSATPIPRTLALTLYGDIDVSRIDEMPPGRQRVDTFVVDESYRNRLNAFIQKEVTNGGQVYIVCPSVEDDLEDGEIGFNELLEYSAERPAMKSAVGFAETLQNDYFPHLRIAFLHGKMKPKEKDAVMKSFSEGKIDVLVSTTVIEVGVNVPNASLIIVENAERFGLAQLHQLRGRVGRGTRKSYCILVSDSEGELAKSRLSVMKTTYDGFTIAEKDLALRGPGDFFSDNRSAFRQSGGLSLPLAHLCTDDNLMKAAFSEASALAKSDPTLSLPENALLKAEVEHLLQNSQHTFS